MTDNRTRLLVIRLQKVFDLTLLLVSFGLTTARIVHSQKEISLSEFLSMKTRISNFVIFGLALFICHIVFCMCGLYRSRRLSSLSAEILDILRAISFSSICFLAIGLLFSVRMITLPFMALFWVVSAALLCTSRFLVRNFLASLRARGKNLRYILILGTNARAMEFARTITASSECGYRVVGFVDDDWDGLRQFKGSGFHLVSNYAGLPDFLRRNVVDEVAIYLPLASFYGHSAEVAGLCEQHGIIMRFNSDIFNRKPSRWRAEEFDGDYFISTHPGDFEGWPLLVKRMLDIAVSFSLLVLLAPVLAGVALAIKLTSPGPILFLQERVGLNKRRFRVYKFRTMVSDAEKLMAKLEARNELFGPVFKIKDDPRITPLGKFLRRSSVDELPQLFNVLKGEMSLVGPRPLAIRDYDGFSEDWQRRRFSVKPGITCLWQVMGRSGIPFDQWMLLDLEYLDEWSLWLDFKILAKTVPAVLRGEGAA